MLLDNDKQTGGCSRRTEDMSHVRIKKKTLPHKYTQCYEYSNKARTEKTHKLQAPLSGIFHSSHSDKQHVFTYSH